MIRGLLLLGLILLSNAAASAAEEKAAEPSPELRAFAQRLVEIVEKQDKKALAGILDWEYVYDHSAYSLCEFESEAAKELSRKEFLEFFKRDAEDFLGAFLRENELVNLLRIQQVTDKESLLLLRYLDDGESQYLEFRVLLDSSNTFKIVDLNVGTSNFGCTTSIDWAVITSHHMKSLKTLGPFQPLRKWLSENQGLYLEFQKALQGNDPNAVIKVFPKLPPEIQKIPFIEYRYYRANAAVERPVLSLREMRAYYEKNRDAGKLFLVFAYCNNQKEYEPQLTIYDEFDRLLGEDPLNNMHRANIHAHLGNSSEAYKYAHQFVKDYPDWKRSHLTLFVIALLCNDDKLVLQQLRVLRDKFKFDRNKMVDQDDLCKNFRKSPEYAEWKKENDGAAAGNKN